MLLYVNGIEVFNVYLCYMLTERCIIIVFNKKRRKKEKKKTIKAVRIC